MPLELHVWGPAFSLPSIDPQCLAAIAYFTQAVPRGEWVLVASSEVALSPSHSFPALKNENVWIGGFRNIVDYVTQYSSGKWQLDGDLEEGERADCIAFSSFIELQGQELLDLSLYVSSNNWNTTVRPLWSKILPLPLPYIVPPSLRAAAKTRTEHLGLSSLDIDSSSEDTKSQDQSSIIPPSLRRPTATVSSLLHQSPEQASQIRLESLATSFFTPLHALRGKTRFFLTSSPTSLDCLALGYLALMLLPDLPSPWLATCMRTKFPQLCAFVHDTERSFFGGSVSLDDAYLTSSTPRSAEELEREKRARGKSGAYLPWIPPTRGSILGLSSAAVSSILDSIPVISSFRQQERFRQALEAEAENDEERERVGEVSTYQRREFVTTLVTCGVAVAMFVGFVVKVGLVENVSVAWRNAQETLQAEKEEEEEARKKEMGSGPGDGSDQNVGWGNALSNLGAWMDDSVTTDMEGRGARREEEMDADSEPVVEVDVSVTPDKVVRDRIV